MRSGKARKVTAQTMDGLAADERREMDQPPERARAGREEEIPGHHHAFLPIYASASYCCPCRVALLARSSQEEVAPQSNLNFCCLLKRHGLAPVVYALLW
jgi:hypothetical protein